MHGKHTRNGSSSLLSAGKIKRRHLPEFFSQLHLGERSLGPLSALLRGKLQILGSEHDIRDHIRFKQLVLRILEHKAHTGPKRLPVKAVCLNVLPIPVNMTGARQQKTIQHLHKG